MISPALKTSVTLAFAGQQKVLAFAGRTAKCNTHGDWVIMNLPLHPVSMHS